MSSSEGEQPQLSVAALKRIKSPVMAERSPRLTNVG